MILLISKHEVKKVVRKKSLREAYGRELVEAAKKDSRIVVLDADLCESTMTCYMEQEIPQRFFEMGISEQNMVSVAAGLALAGKVPFVNSFSVFTTGQPYNQIRQGVALPKLSVKIFGSSCGLSDAGDGATHQSVEDIAIMRAIPNMTVIVPVDAIETKKVVRAVIEYPGPVYVRISRAPLPILTEEDTPFQIGKMSLIKDGSDITIFACGLMVYQALRAREVLADRGISVRVVNVNTIKPLDRETLKKYSQGTKGVITAEEHSIIGGLGGAVTEALSNQMVRIERVGIEDVFGQSAQTHEELLEYYSLTPENIIEKAEGLVKYK